HQHSRQDAGAPSCAVVLLAGNDNCQQATRFLDTDRDDEGRGVVSGVVWFADRLPLTVTRKQI
ncbi:MAG: hypothetical protein LBK71_03835, partial [Verrucomicrobiales bacterium]|nr:hypothetical protein [Verrucomicrobiales bacterium]